MPDEVVQDVGPFVVPHEAVIDVSPRTRSGPIASVRGARRPMGRPAGNQQEHLVGAALGAD